MKSFIKEFKEFINKGNVMDMAVGVVMGTAFTAIVTSLVEDIVMPLIGIIVGGVSIEELSVTVGGAVLKYGVFLQNVINFLLIALVVFTVIKSINKMHDKLQEALGTKEEPVEEEVVIPDDIKLLTEIRDLLKDKK